jgi:ER lumen protein retaining receptor
MQELYAIVFICRYMDLLWSFVSIYNTVMKVIFITATIYLIHMMRFRVPVCQTYERETDSFPYELYLLGPCALMGLLTTEEYAISEILWTFSIWLESVAVLPQLVMLQKEREVENLTKEFVGTMGAYRAFYILNWVLRYFTDGYVNYVGWIGGIVQTALYGDFLYFYVKSKMSGSKLILPVAA